MEDNNQQWGSGYLVCLNCYEEHIGAWVAGDEPFDCPYCDYGCCVPYDGFVYLIDK